LDITSKRKHALGVLAHEPEHAAEMPHRVAREEPPIDHLGPIVVDHCCRDVPPLPAGARGPIAEVDVLDVVAICGIPASQLVEHGSAHEQEGTEQPVGPDGLSRSVVEQVVVPLAFQWGEEESQRRAADDRPAKRGEATPRRLPRAVRPEHARPRDPAARMLAHERGEERDRAVGGDRIRVGEDHELTVRGGDARVDVGGQRLRSCVLQHAHSVRHLRDGRGRVRDHDDLIDLRQERRQRRPELHGMVVRDDNGRDHRRRTSR
jgi:hypothetical protein